jgi:predicted NBD/HSP70 family sugar kinase
MHAFNPKEGLAMNVDALIKPDLDPEFIPAVLWNKNYREKVEASAAPVDVVLALVRPDDTCSVYATRILPLSAETEATTLHYIERILKFLLWQRGGCKVMISGCDPLGEKLSAIYSPEGARAFDYEFFGEKVYGHPLEFVACAASDIPEVNELSLPLGRHLDGCRIGFDLGGSDRKCAAVIDGKVVFSEEIEWNPYFEKDPSYHIEGINDTLKRAAAHLPRVDAIGGSSAGVYVNSEVRVALNDGEVTALAGSMSMKENAVLGLAMGTSEAVGYVTPDGNITPWLNELAFAPVDFRENAPSDEWSGDIGCGVQYFSQQAVARLVPASGIELPSDMPFPEQLIEVQKLMAEGDERAAKIYSTIGTYLGYAIAHYADFYEMRKMLLLGRVTSGQGGSIIIEKAQEVLAAEFPELEKQIEIVTPNEKDKRHGQAVAAASLPMIGGE